jgi:sugar porter (SP) family MFS transporter
LITQIDPLYIAEIVPSEHRGQLVTYSEVALNVGIVLGFASGLVFAPMNDKLEWRSMLAVGIILPLLMILLISIGIMPESPRWLVSKNRSIEARYILQKIYPPGFATDQVISEIQASIELENVTEQYALGWNAIFFPAPAVRRMLFVGIGTAVAQQAVGIDAIQYYLSDVIEHLGIPSDSFQSSITLILLGSLKLVMILVGGYLFDSIGRRPLLLVSLVGVFFSLFSISIAFFIDSTASFLTTNIIVIIGLGVYLSFFSLGIGPGGWLIPSEIFSLLIRGKATSVATVCNRITSTLMSSTFLTTVDLIGLGGFFLTLSFISVIVFLFQFYFLPETNGKSIDEMCLYFTDITNDSSLRDTELQFQQILQSSPSLIESNDIELPVIT